MYVWKMYLKGYLSNYFQNIIAHMIFVESMTAECLLLTSMPSGANFSSIDMDIYYTVQGGWKVTTYFDL